MEKKIDTSFVTRIHFSLFAAAAAAAGCHAQWGRLNVLKRLLLWWRIWRGWVEEDHFIISSDVFFLSAICRGRNLKSTGATHTKNNYTHARTLHHCVRKRAFVTATAQMGDKKKKLSNPNTSVITQHESSQPAFHSPSWPFVKAY